MSAVRVVECLVCGAALRPAATGRPRRFCSDRCRQRVRRGDVSLFGTGEAPQGPDRAVPAPGAAVGPQTGSRPCGGPVGTENGLTAPPGPAEPQTDAEALLELAGALGALMDRLEAAVEALERHAVVARARLRAGR